MHREFLQEKSLNRSYDNAEKSLNVDLSAKSRLIPYSTTAGMLGLYNLYTEERDACESYRMIFTVNPVCSNLIYNAVTEPVRMEGSYSAINLVETSVERDDESVFPEGTINQSADTVDRLAAIRDTEYSHDRIGDFKYHCGYDIFNNHILRSNEFEHVSLERKGDNAVEFNTIFDFAIDYSGKTVQRVLGESNGPLTNGLPKTKIRMYGIDTIKSMNTAFYDGFRSVDGWYGFYNAGYINIPNAVLNGKEISLNCVLNNEPRCSFIDFYPDRTLYSFIPKVNRFKKRIEKNWDCAIAYPYKSDYELFSEINGNQINAIKIIRARVVYNNVGDEMIEMYSKLRNTLKPGDEVRIFYAPRIEDSEPQFTRFSLPVAVVSLGDSTGNDTDRKFTVKLSDLSTFCEILTDEETNEKKLVLKSDGTTELMFAYKKIDGGYDNKYYFRKFRKLKKFVYEEIPNGESVNAKTVLKEPEFVNESSPTEIRYNGRNYRAVSSDLVYTQNKIAFAGNIYGDRVAQVIFNDDICITGLKDNLGRPLSKVYFVVEKTNRGHDEWYASGITSSDTIEYSHCFGDVTSGLDLPFDDDSNDYNVRKLHNVFKDECPSDYLSGLSAITADIPVGSYSGTPMPIENSLAISDYDEFYGDIVEFSKVNFKETTIEKVYHRFNTAQRECLTNEKYFNINYDDLISDLYDL